jgi:polyisoprenoid-binding protein YceI
MEGAGMDRRRRWAWIAGGAAGVVVALVGAVVLWWSVLRDDAPPPADIEGAVAVVGSTTTTSVARTGDAATTSAVTTTAPRGPADALSGTWQVDTRIGSFDDFTSTWAGYRIQEELDPIGSNTAAGRTPDVSGTLELVGPTIAAVDVEVDMTTLRSDESRRDNQLRSRGLETDRFPTASFTLTEPITLDAAPAEGQHIAVDATGDLTLHGVTRPVTFTLDAQLVGDVIAVVGSTEIALADFDIDKPTGFLVLSIADTGTIELQLFFTRT